MWTLVACLQGKLAEVFLGLRKYLRIFDIYNKTHGKADERS